MKVYAMKIPDKLSDYDFINYLNRIPVEKKEKLKNYLDRGNAIQSLLGILLIQNIIYENTGINRENISFNYNDYGKPYIDNLPTFHFNISHSDEWVVCATDSLPIGIDIESIRPIDLEIAKLFFTKEEYEFIRRTPDKDKTSVFYEYWTLKEAYIKAIGKGLSIPLNSFSILNNTGKYFLKHDQNSTYFLYHRYIGINSVLALCTQNQVNDFKITYIEYNNLV